MSNMSIYNEGKIIHGIKRKQIDKPQLKDEFGRLPGQYQIWRQHVSEMETWSPFMGQEFLNLIGQFVRSQPLDSHRHNEM